MRLFPRGDCAETCLERSTSLASWRWAKCVLTRADFALWRLDVEFIASLYNLFLRRDQIGAVEACVKRAKHSNLDLEELQKVTATNLVTHALSSGDVNRVRDLLKRKNLDGPLRNTFQHMQLIQRGVRGSEAEKDNILPKFTALRLWSGCSSLFYIESSRHPQPYYALVGSRRHDCGAQVFVGYDWCGCDAVCQRVLAR